MDKNTIFTNADYNSCSGMKPNIWGPPLWFVLHIISFNYPVHPTKNDKKNYFTFIKSLEHVLPCRSCRDNYKEHIKTIDISVFDNRESFSIYMFKLHNIINSTLDKQTILTYKNVRNVYENFRFHDNEKYKCNDAQCLIKISKFNKHNKTITINNSCLSIKK